MFFPIIHVNDCRTFIVQSAKKRKVTDMGQLCKYVISRLKDICDNLRYNIDESFDNQIKFYMSFTYYSLFVSLTVIFSPPGISSIGLVSFCPGF